jgi:hypothetical protein
MLRDVFYYGKKPNVHPREQFAENLADARIKATTRDFWIINEFCDYRNFDWDFDFEFLPDEDVWAEDHNNVWPSQHQKDSGTWLCPKEHSDLIIYRCDVDPVARKNEKQSDNWVELDLIDHTKFDFSWHPDPTDPPFVYKWGCKFYPAELNHVLEYRVPGATREKYMSAIVELLPQPDLWVEHQTVDKHKFDMSWRPDPLDNLYIYVWGNKYIDGKLKPTLEYHTPGATEKKYMPELVEVLPEWDRWEILHPIVKSSFDFSWRPDPREPDFNYVFGNNQYPGELMPTVIYKMPNATQEKYIEDITAKLDVNMNNWVVPDNIDVIDFDFSWVPDPKSPPYIYEFGTQWQNNGGPQYIVPNATEKTYVDIQKAKRLPSIEGWEVFGNYNLSGFDFSWHPDNNSPPYVYIFGNQWYPAEITPTLQYSVAGATEIKYISDPVAQLSNDMTNWTVPANVDQTKFDFSWYPDPGAPPYIYEFATVWNERGGPVYTVPGATEYKYVEDIKAGLLSDKTHWEIPTGVDNFKFDFSWVPHPDAPPYIYQFATRLDDIWVDDGPKYLTPGHDGFVVRLENSILYNGEIEYPKYTIETTLEDLVKRHPTEQFWALNKNINYDTFDFTWKPDKENLFNVTVFGSAESETTHTYFVNATYYLDGYTDFNYIQPETELDSQYLASIFVKPDMFFVDRSNPESAARFEALRAKYGTRIQKTRYLNSWVDTINRCTKKATTELIWVLNSELDYSEFEFNYYPNPWQMKMVHVFGTQWSHWGTTFMINTETFAEDTKYIKIIEHLSNLNFVKSIKAKAVDCVYDVVMIDHGNKETTSICNYIENKINGKDIIIVKYDNSYLNTLRSFLTNLPVKKEHYIWVCSSVCDYSNFDFTYICDPFTRENLHVFPSGKQKFGDTFLIDVNKTRELIDEITELGEYDQVNYNQTMRVNRIEAPKLITEHDTLVDAIKDSILDIDFPYATLMTVDNTDLDETEYEPLSLWSKDSKNIIITTTGATRIVIPKEAKDYIDCELYDYPYIKRAPKLVKSNPLDIVFLSNGETGAEENYEHLLKIAENLPNRVVRVDGVNGRAKAYHAAAEASNTPWFFAVFAKLQINNKFDFSWQPDRMQIPKHYIFHAKNPVNGLIYGHQAMIAYNKKLTLGNEGHGLDFTLDSEHEVVPLISGIAHYNTDSFSTWRTAFREAIKLRQGNDDDSRDRLDAWLTKAEGDFAEYSIKGAQDAMTYYDEVNGDFDKLKLSYEWAWLHKRFNAL